MSRNSAIGRRLLVAALLVLFAAPAFAQKFTGSIRGTVTDTSNAVVAGAKVNLKNEETGLSRSMVSNADGNYSFSDLPVGNYRIDVEFTGFKTAAKTKIAVSSADTRAVDFQLSTGDLTETVSVEAEANAVKTVGAEISGLVTGDTARELPLNGRNFMQLTLLQPGVTGNQTLDTTAKGLAGGSDISVSGGSTTSNLWLVDGADNVDRGSNRTILIYPSVDAIEEFKVQRNNYGAEFGQAGGAQIQVITKGGTNAFHGTGYYFARRDSLNSKDYFLEQAGQDKAPLKWDDFGGTIGGPIMKDKLHFFLSYEKNKDAKSSVRSGFVPTAAERAGDFSGAGTPGCTQPAPIDPLTGQPFPGNKIPADRLSPGGVAFANLYQLPNNTPSSGCNNYTAAVAAPVDWNQIHARVDWSITNNTRLMVRYTKDSWKADNTILWGDSPTSTVGSNWDQPGKSLVAQLNQNIGSNMTNALTFSYSANSIAAARTGDAGKVDTINGLIPTSYPASIKEQGGAAQPLFWGAGPYGNLWNQSPWKNNEDLYVVKDDWSAVFGKHFVKAGAFYSTNAKNEEVNNTSQESIAFGGSAGYVTPSGYRSGLNTGNALADLILAGTAYGTGELVTNPYVQQRWHDIEFYGADSWKIAPRWTLDYGLRFSHMQPPYMKDDRMGNFVLANATAAAGNSSCNGVEYPPGTNPCGDLGLAGGSDGPNRQLVPTKFLWWAPRIGLAWDVYGDGKMAIRGGVGRFYQRDRVSPGLGVGTTPPFSGTASVTRTLDSVNPVDGGSPAAGFGAPSNALDQVAANSNYWQWNVGVERQVAKKTVVQVAYVGSKGLDLFGQTNLNEIAPANRLAYAVTNSATLAPLNGIASIGNGQLALWTHNRDSIYHSIQTGLVSRWGRGSQVALSYTFAKQIMTTGDNADGPGLSTGNAYTDSTNPGLDRARGNNDVTHSFNGTLVLMLPTLEGKSSVARNVFGDWEVSTIVRASTGYPITISTGTVPGLPGGSSGTNFNNGARPNVVDGQECQASGGDKTQWLNPNAWTLNNYQVGTNGNTGRNTCNGPGLFQTDASLYKNIKLGSGGVKLQLRFEVYNVFNTVNFIGSSLNSTYGAQNVVLSADKTTIISAAPAGNFGQLTAARDPRTMQLGIRLSF